MTLLEGCWYSSEAETDEEMFDSKNAVIVVGYIAV
jgi:hypothetical protein